MSNPDTDLLQRLQKVHDSLPPKLPPVPKVLVELARSQKKLNEVREMKQDNKREMGENELKCQGIVLESFKKALIDLDIMHKKAVVELKSIEPKIMRLK